MRLGDPVELGLELLQPARLRLERGEEGVEIGRGLAQPELDVAQLVAGPLQLGREPLEGRHRALCKRDEVRCAVAVVRSERRRGSGRAVGELRDVPVPLSLGSEALLVPRLHPFAVLDERAQLRESGLGERGVRASAPPAAGEPPAGRATPARAAARRASCSSPQKRSSTSSWYDGRAKRRCSNWPDIATMRSTAAATSSRAAARPQA